MTNYTRVKSFMEPQAYKVVNKNAHEISGWRIISRILHSRAPHLGGINGYVQSDLSILEFKNGQQLEYFHIKIIKLQQEIILSGETLSPTRILFHYMKALSKSDKIKSLIAPKMKDIITFLDNNKKLAVYTGVNIHGIYRYLETLGSPNKLTPSGQSSHQFGTSYSTNNDTATLQTVIADFCIRNKSICEFCERIVHKADACIIYGLKLIPPSLIRKMNQFISLHGE